MFNPNKYSETPKHPGLLITSTLALVAGAAVMNNYIEGGREIAGRRTETDLCFNDLVDADKNLVGFAGCMQDGQDTYNALVERTKGVNLIVPRLPEFRPDGQIDELEICKKIIDKLISTRAYKPDIIADSRGAIDAKRLIHYAHDTGAAEVFGNFGKVILNASPHDGKDITWSRNMLLDGAILFQHFAAPDRIKPSIMRWTGHDSAAYTPLTKIAIEGKSIRVAPDTDALPPIIDELIYVRGPHKDPTVRTKQASKKYELDAPAGTFTEYIDKSRMPGGHIGGPSRFDLMLRLAGITQPVEESISDVHELPVAV